LLKSKSKQKAPRRWWRRGARSRLLVSLGERIRLHQIGGLVDDVVLTVFASASDPGFAPQVMILVDAHIALGRTLEFDTGRRGGDLVDIEAAGLFRRELP
jgi:hypothetical protein